MSCIYLTIKLLVIIFMLTILKGKNCVLLNPIQELIEMEASYVRRFSYVDNISFIKE